MALARRPGRDGKVGRCPAEIGAVLVQARAKEATAARFPVDGCCVRELGAVRQTNPRFGRQWPLGRVPPGSREHQPLQERSGAVVGSEWSGEVL